MTIDIPAYPAVDGPNIAKRLANGREGLELGAEALEDRMSVMDDAMIAIVDARAERLDVQRRVRDAVKGAKK